MAVAARLALGRLAYATTATTKAPRSCTAPAPAAAVVVAAVAAARAGQRRLLATEASSFAPPARVSEGAHVDSLAAYRRLYAESIAEPDAFWGRVAEETVQWERRPERVRQGEGFGDVSWFGGGRLNAAVNCVDRHAARTPDGTAIVWEGDDPGDVRRVSWRELLHMVSRMANLLHDELGVRAGERVAIYMPMVPEAAAAMLACARIGAVHSVIFAGFSAEAVRDRINDAAAAVVITASHGRRGGKPIALKQTVDEALLGCPGVKHVLVHRHGDGPTTTTTTANSASSLRVAWHPQRDMWLHEAMARHRPVAPATPMDAEAPLFVLYTSGSTGRPKGLVHTTGGYLVYAAATHRWVFDYRPGDLYACMADIGWITGHSYIVYGPLANGATTFMFESLPTHPTPARYWQMVERHRIASLYTAPTAIRSLMALGDDHVRRHDRSSLRVLGSVGEPINPEAWRWYHNVVGDQRCAIVDTYWQTETGGIVVSPLPGATPTKPGSATLPLPGIEPVLLDATSGKELPPAAAAAATTAATAATGTVAEGVLAFRRPWPGIARTILGDHQRYIDSYLRQYPGYFFTGDGCKRDADGYLWITGRVDDVINKAGHRIGTAEVESALVAHWSCAEAAVVGVPDAIKGQAILAFVSLRSDAPLTPKTADELRAEVRKLIGGLAVPDYVVVSQALPKTRSGKIMRRVLRKIAERASKDSLGDLSTLADPAVVDQLIAKVEQAYAHPQHWA